ncbi:hypothetical protein [Guptibacillus hwajinpoensis]|uniref:Uncharacterized protein n=1 Tax=Guptibacillus hwajinpoensis TaxID=208199 RepID=A0ABU0K2U0_9BACL|nr:hypothetical protein [Alkalihalobacillus hemicentroti]MDQ0483673.1 hypothetical protein [Alkalihalobacillus hemicentroti]
MFFPEAKDLAQVEFYTFIASMIYLFIVSIMLFYIFYRLAMVSNHKGLMNFFMYLMSLLLRLPFQSVEVIGESQLSRRQIIKEVWKELLVISVATIWFLIGLILAYFQIQDFKN